MNHTTKVLFPTPSPAVPGISPEVVARAVQTTNLPQGVVLASSAQTALGLADSPPPSSNTGVERTEGVQRASVDYLRFVVNDGDLGALLTQFGGDPANWVDGKGGHFYTQSKHYGGITIYHDGREAGMGICVQLSGQGCREYEGMAGFTSWKWEFINFCKMKEAGRLHFTRVDIALDDTSSLLTMERVKSSTYAGHFTCRSGWQDEQHLSGGGFGDLAVTVKNSRKRGKVRQGATVNFGSRTSSAMMRFYDKAAEREARGCAVEGEWVRAEYEAHDERADLLADAVAASDANEMGVLFASVMSVFIDFKKPNPKDSNKRRWVSEVWWQDFLATWAKTRLLLAPLVHSYDKLRAWAERQVAPSLAVLYEASENGRQMMTELMRAGRDRYKDKHRQMIKAEQARRASGGVDLAGRLVPASGPTGF
jgi:phage replication initiation protein